MIKKAISILLSTAMLLTLVCAMIVHTSAAAEGDWTTYRSATEYPKEGEEPNPEKVYKPEAGYTYTKEGFTVVPADYKDTTPYMTVQTKEAQYIKDGVYMQFRVDDYAYAGDAGADQWIGISLNSQPNVAIGNTKHGGGWSDCIRGVGDGNGSCTSAVTMPDEENAPGVYQPVGFHNITVPLDEEGREIYTLEISWDGYDYDIKINGQSVPGSTEITNALEYINENGEFYVGVTLYSMVGGGTAALTVLKYGSSKDDAATPVGSDSKEPEKNEMVVAEIADPSTVGANMPAILWDPETVTMGAGYNCQFAVLGDSTWRVTASDPSIFFGFSPKRSWSYDGKDFPIFCIMFRNGEDLIAGSLWYAAGQFMGAQNDHVLPFDTFEGEFFDTEKGEYNLVCIDLTDYWEGRINSIRLDFSVYNGAEFDVCYAGMFRSEEEAAAYAKAYLTSVGLNPDKTKTDVTETDTDRAVDTQPETTAPGTSPAATEPAAATDPGTVETDTSGSGCRSTAAVGAVMLTIAAAAAFMHRKKH